MTKGNVLGLPTLGATDFVQYERRGIAAQLLQQTRKKPVGGPVLPPRHAQPDAPDGERDRVDRGLCHPTSQREPGAPSLPAAPSRPTSDGILSLTSAVSCCSDIGSYWTLSFCPCPFVLVMILVSPTFPRFWFSLEVSPSCVGREPFRPECPLQAPIGCALSLLLGPASMPKLVVFPARFGGLNGYDTHMVVCVTVV